MTVREVYELLCSRIYYELASSSTFRFSGNTMFIDRRAGVPFSLREEQGVIYLDTVPQQGEDQLRIETNHPDGSPFHFFGKNSGREILVLD
ncbi:hypothetical protein [Chitinophaga barathri]|uniref:Uncharacterized protein n=1 Tax=Chitinophaga barathri TaxID=1647451 RepID=A0A3N4M7U4_9BACT|nr:hypothetical protein [Chitinophaga barathri]RPD39552.1 hypothetical protein EG028_18000 [Chitinophaga barathri]